MKKLLGLFCLVLLIACESPSSIWEKKAAIIKQFGQCEIANIPNDFNAYIVKDSSGTIWYVETNWNLNTINKYYQLMPDPNLTKVEVKPIK
jgi:hypothetical protein